jgi:hypothetical protein
MQELINCRFCNQLREGRRSHLTPKSAAPKNTKAIILHSSGKSYGAIGSNMLFDQEIFCDLCEPKFGKVDDKFFEFICAVKKAGKFSSDVGSEFCRLGVDVDLEWLDVFAASVLYRHSMSDRSKVSLGKNYENIAKEMLERYNLNQSVSDGQKIFGALCVVNSSRIISKNIVPVEIAQNKVNGIRIYKLILDGGIEIHIKVSNQPNPLQRLRDEYCIIEGNFGDSLDKKLMERFLKSVELKNQKNSNKKS